MKTQNNHLPIIGSLLTILQSHGVLLVAVDNDPQGYTDPVVLDGTLRQRRQQAKREINATDESRLYVEVNGKKRWIYIVLGNEPEELVADYSVDATLDVVCEEFSSRWEGIPVPVKQVL